MERKIKVTATETTVYSKEYTVEELEEVAGITLADVDDDLDLFMDEVIEGAREIEGFQEELERHGDLQGQVWEGEWVDPTPEQVGYTSHDAIRVAVYEEEGHRE